MRRTLSSKTVESLFPILFIGAVCCGLVMCWLGKVTGRDGTPLSVGTLCLLTVIGAAVVPWMIMGVVKDHRRVQVDDGALYVSNYVTEVRIPLSEVARVRDRTGYKRLDYIIIDLRHRSAFGKRIEFYPPLRLFGSGIHPVARELKALCKQAGGENGVGDATPSDPAEKLFEAGDDCVQVGKDYILQGCEGKDEVCEKDRFFFKDLARISVVRSKKSGRITAIDYKVSGKSGTFEIGGYTLEEMQEIAGLLEARAKSWPIQFLEKQISGSNYVALFSSGLGAIAATICSGWLLHFGWTVRDQLSVGLGLLLFAILFLPTVGVAAFLWFVFWDNLRD